MQVTFGPAKNVRNLHKHGISLARAADFNFDDAIYVPDDTQQYGEARMTAVGWLDARLHTLVFTEDRGALRAISLRTSTPTERKLYAETQSAGS